MQQYPTKEPSQSAWYWIGECYLNLEKEAAAIDAFARQAGDYPKNKIAPEALLKLGDIYQRQADCTRAIGSYQKVVETYPETETAGRAKLQIGVCYLKLGESDLANRTFDQIIDKYPESEIAFRARLELGKNSLSNSRFDDALRDFKAVVAFQTPDLSAEAQYWIGEVFFNQKDYAKAAIEYLKIKYLFPGVPTWSVRGIYQAGLANENQQRFGEARLLYRNIIEQYPDKEYQQKAQLRLQQISGK
jgi:TolA-binding protein